MRSDAQRARARRRALGPTPAIVIIIAVVGFGALVALPLASLAVRTPWSAFGDLLADDTTTTAIRLSLVVSTSATALAALFGIPLAWILARTVFPLRSLVRALVLVPLVLPPVVGGVLLLLALGRRGIAGQYLDSWFGITLPFTTNGAIVATTFVALPYLVLTVEGALRSVDLDLEEAAATNGASRLAIWRRVTLPAIAPALGAGVALAWARALGEFGATITFAGSVEGRTQTMPLAVFRALESDRDAALALSVVMLVISVAVLVAVGSRTPQIRHPVAGAAR